MFSVNVNVLCPSQRDTCIKCVPAIRCMVAKVCRDGADVAARMPLLSAYLGHVGPASTYWYLQATPELLAVAAQWLEQLKGQRS